MQTNQREEEDHESNENTKKRDDGIGVKRCLRCVFPAWKRTEQNGIGNGKTSKDDQAAGINKSTITMPPLGHPAERTEPKRHTQLET